jgi:hypothetical protein
VLAFALTLLAAPIAARWINVLLEERVYTRARLPRGTPYVLSTLVRYAVYAFAFLAALAAAGCRSVSSRSCPAAYAPEKKSLRIVGTTPGYSEEH